MLLLACALPWNSRADRESTPTPDSSLPSHLPSFWLPAAPILCCVNRFWLYRVGSAAAAYCWIPEYACVRASMVLPVPLERPLLPRPPFKAAIPWLQGGRGEGERGVERIELTDWRDSTDAQDKLQSLPFHLPLSFSMRRNTHLSGQISRHSPGLTGNGDI